MKLTRNWLAIPASAGKKLFLKFHRRVPDAVRQLLCIRIRKTQFVIDRDGVWRRIYRDNFILIVIQKKFSQLFPNALSMVFRFDKKAADVFSILICGDHAF